MSGLKHPAHLPEQVAGMPTYKAGDMFRCQFIMSNSPLMQYCNPEKRWNYPGCPSTSSVPYPIIGMPFNTSKPRKGRWGETLGTRYSDLSQPLEEQWEQWRKTPKKVLEHRARLEARAELARRIDRALRKDK